MRILGAKGESSGLGFFKTLVISSKISNRAFFALAKDSLKILTSVAIFFYITCVLSSYLILIIPDELNIYLTPLLAITGAIMIAQSKNIFYTLCNTLTQEQICIVHKGKIMAKRYICPKCFTTYCNRCYIALKSNKDSCWYCNIDLL